jgi:cytoskeletal protein RodZ
MTTQTGGLPLASGWANRSQSERDRMKDVLEHLKTERLCLGWTLQDVSDRTGISITVLKALESGNSDNLVAPSAVDGLLRKYSTVLEAQTEQTADRAQKTTGRDGARSCKTFGHIMRWSLLSVVFAAVFLGIVFWQIRETKYSSVKSPESAVSQTETTPSSTPEQKTSSGHEELPPRHQELPEVEKQPTESSPPDTALSSVPTPEQDAIPPAEPDEKSVVSIQPPDTALSSVPTPEQDAIPPAEPDEKSVASIQPPATARPAHSLEMVADQRTWIQVIVDGKNTETGLLEAGETRKWRAMDKVGLVVGNGGGVRLWWDRKPVEISSRRGRVVRLTLPRP